MNTPNSTYTGFWLRVFAAIVDSVLLLLVVYPLLIAIYGWSYFDTEETGFVAGPAELVIVWVLPIFVVIGFWIWRQATPAKMAIKVAIVDAATGEKPTMKQWILRYIGYFVSIVPLGLGYVWVAFDKRKQGWHDKLAGTVVVPRTELVSMNRVPEDSLGVAASSPGSNRRR